MGNPFAGLESIPEAGQIPTILQSILDGDIQAPSQLDELKDFRTKREGDFRNVTVVGMRHRRHKDHLMRNKRIGHSVILVPEPANPYDPDAIAVYTTMPVYGPEAGSYTWIMAGYVSRTQTCHILDKTKVYEGNILHKTSAYWDISVTHERVF